MCSTRSAPLYHDAEGSARLAEKVLRLQAYQAIRVVKIDVYHTIRLFKRTLETKVDWKSTMTPRAARVLRRESSAARPSKIAKFGNSSTKCSWSEFGLFYCLCCFFILLFFCCCLYFVYVVVYFVVYGVCFCLDVWRVRGLGFGVCGFGFRVSGLKSGLRGWCPGFGIWCLGFGVWSLGFRVHQERGVMRRQDFSSWHANPASPLSPHTMY